MGAPAPPTPTVATDIDPIFQALHDRVTTGHPHFERVKELEEACVSAPGWQDCIGNPHAEVSLGLSAAIWNLQCFAIENDILSEAEMAELYPEPVPA